MAEYSKEGKQVHDTDARGFLYLEYKSLCTKKDC